MNDDDQSAARRPPADSPTRVPWTVIDVLVCLLIVTVIYGITSLFMPRAHGADINEITPREGADLFAKSAIASLVSTGLAIAWLVKCSRASAKDLGFSVSRLVWDVALGAFGFLAMVIPLLLIKAAIKASGVFEGEHPIETLLRQYPDFDLWLWATVAAVIVAPLSEEFFFRVLLQGWLERIWPSQPRTVAGGSAGESGAESSPPPPPRWKTWLPVLISSLIFAAVHYNHGPDPIPLFFLALLLGTLYRWTHRIWPSMTVHVLLNGTSMALLIAQSYLKQQ
ncbi:MAG: CPBP family intramembrane metalloprotease [Planctomycetes bacterium]|nr:CPBP family intramembrane metalloprotease [Planctomycetota bacterium]